MHVNTSVLLVALHEAVYSLHTCCEIFATFPVQDASAAFHNSIDLSKPEQVCLVCRGLLFDGKGQPAQFGGCLGIALAWEDHAIDPLERPGVLPGIG